MTIQERSFEDMVQALRDLDRGEVEKYDDVMNYMAEVGYSYQDLSKWPDSPPVPSIYKLKRDPDEGPLTDPKSLVDASNYQAVGTWNANGDGRWVAGDGWILLSVTLVQEQAEDQGCGGCGGGGAGDYVPVAYGLRKVTDGYASMIWPKNDQEAITKVFGLEHFPVDGWESVEVWHGE